MSVLGESVTVGTFVGLALILFGSSLAASGKLPWRRTLPAPPEPAAGVAVSRT